MQNNRLDTQALGIALCALVGVAILPWYAIEDGFWSIKWLLDGFPLVADTSPALFLWFKARGTFQPMAMALLASNFDLFIGPRPRGMIWLHTVHCDRAAPNRLLLWRALAACS